MRLLPELTKGRSKMHHKTADAPHTAGRVLHGARWYDLVTRVMLHHLPEDLRRPGLAEIRRVLKPGGRFLAMDFATHSHAPRGPGRPLGHLLALCGHARGASIVDTLMPMLQDAGFSDVEGIPTRHKNVAFIRAR